MRFYYCLWIWNWSICWLLVQYTFFSEEFLVWNGKLYKVLMPSQDRACDCYASGLIITLLQLLHLSSHIPLHHMRQQNIIRSYICKVMIHTIVRNDLLSSSISKEIQNFDRFFLMHQSSNYPLCIRCLWMAPRPQQFSRASTPWLSTWSRSTQWWERRAASPSKDPRPRVCFLSLAFWLTFSLVSFDFKAMRL